MHTGAYRSILKLAVRNMHVTVALKDKHLSLMSALVPHVSSAPVPRVCSAPVPRVVYRTQAARHNMVIMH